mmetsp:Transcript_10018/g.18834  ORF Transcript_10018/g.18834 Transcript_10018/m.18834 type:complete len:403 (+) Transcript_10018:139-1347(+)
MWRRWSHLSTPGKVVASITAGAAGAGAVYFLGHRIWEAIETTRADAEAFIDRRLAFEHQQATSKVTSQFKSVQTIADCTTLPSLLPHLEAHLQKLVDVSEITDKLAAAKLVPTSLTTTDKYALWEELVVRSFVAALSAAATVSLLVVFLRVQLNVIGRYLYLDLAFDAAQDSRPPMLSKACQHKFLAHADFLLQQGMHHLVASIRSCVQETMQPFTLKSTLTRHQLQGILHQVHFKFLHASAGTSWQEVLLPPFSQDSKNSPRSDVAGQRPYPLTDQSEKASSGDLTMQPSASHLIPNSFQSDQDDEHVRALIAETRLVLEGPEFRRVVESAIFKSVCMLGDRTGNCFADDTHPIPLPKLLPHMKSATAGLLCDPDAVASAIAELPELEAFCANIFSSPPAL